MSQFDVFQLSKLTSRLYNIIMSWP